MACTLTSLEGAGDIARRLFLVAPEQSGVLTVGPARPVGVARHGGSNVAAKKAEALYHSVTALAVRADAGSRELG